MKILITGGAGFIGSYLTDFFIHKNHQVIVFDNLSWGNKKVSAKFIRNPNFKFQNINLCNDKSLKKNFPKKIDLTVHLAANSDIRLSSSDPIIDFNNTSVATFNLLNAIRINKVPKILYTSGSGVYGDWGNKKISEDNGPMIPVSMYGATKLSAEAMIAAYSNLFGITAYILRPANIIGPGQTHGVISDFVDKLHQNPEELVILGNGEQKKSYIYIEDVINAITVILKKSKEVVNIFNIATRDLITVNEIAKLVIKEMKIKNTKIKHTQGKIGWKGDIPVVVLNSHALRKLGWKNKYSTSQAVIKTIQGIIKNKGI